MSVNSACVPLSGSDSHHGHAFATVSFWSSDPAVRELLCEDSGSALSLSSLVPELQEKTEKRPLATFRVPVYSQTTIKQLAKEALQRLVYTRRQRSDSCAAGAFTAGLSHLKVVGVHVSGGSHPPAEVFSHDLVNQVVMLGEERIHFKLLYSPRVFRAPAAGLVEEMAGIPSQRMSDISGTSTEDGAGCAYQDLSCGLHPFLGQDHSHNKTSIVSTSAVGNSNDGGVRNKKNRIFKPTGSPPLCLQQLARDSGGSQEEESTWSGMIESTAPNHFIEEDNIGKHAPLVVRTVRNATTTEGPCFSSFIASSSIGDHPAAKASVDKRTHPYSMHMQEKEEGATPLSDEKTNCTPALSQSLRKRTKGATPPRRCTWRAAQRSRREETAKKSANTRSSEVEQKKEPSSKPGDVDGQALKARRSSSGHCTTDSGDGSHNISDGKQPLGWGPKSHEIYPDNYVSSPEKLMRRGKKQEKSHQVNSTGRVTSELDEEVEVLSNPIHLSATNSSNRRRTSSPKVLPDPSAKVGEGRLAVMKDGGGGETSHRLLSSVAPLGLAKELQKTASGPLPAALSNKISEVQRTTMKSRESQSTTITRKKGWGPEAYKHFAPNFVNSPDRYARELRNRKRQEEEEKRKRQEEGSEKTEVTPVL